MNAFFTDLVSILRAIPHLSVWIGAVIVLGAMVAAVRLTPLGRRIGREATLSMAAFVLVLVAVLNVVHLASHDGPRPWRRLHRAKTTLFGRATERPLNAYTYGNESILFLNEYLNGRRLVVAADGTRRIWDNNGTSLDSATTALELIFAPIERENYPEALSPAQVAELAARPHYTVGITGRNLAVFVFGDEYPSCRDVYMFVSEETFYVVPGPLARRLLAPEASWKP
ncbi:MAG: hypothetical protein WAW96_02915 [Alphaproteobacteria bacterium]